METPSSQASPTPPGGTAGGILDFTRLWHILLRRAWVLVVCTTLTVAAGIFYLAVTPKQYTAFAVVQVEQIARQPMNFQDAQGVEDLKSVEVVKTFEQVLGSGTLLLRVVHANGLADNKDFAPPKATGAPYTDAELAERMASRVTVDIRRGTRLIDIGVTDHDPVLAAKLADSIVTEYRRMELEQQLDASRGPTEFLLKQERELKAKVEASELALANYRAQNQAVSLEDKQNIVVDKLRDLNLKVTEAKGRRLQLEADIGKLGSLQNAKPEELLQIASINDVPAVSDLRRQINQKEGEFAAIKERYLWKHIKYVEAESSLRKLKDALNVELANAAEAITRSYQNAKSTEDKLAAALHEQEQQALALGNVAIPYNTLLRQSQTDHALYDSVLTRLKENNVAQGISPTTLRLVQAPLTPYHASKPARLKTLIIAAAAGMFLGGALILMLELLKHTLQTVDQAEAELGLPLLAALPEHRGRRRGRGAGMALLGPEAAPEREAFRTLRTTLTMLNEQDVRSVMFTSAVPGEGKSFCSLNFAAAQARAGHQTLLINADLRRNCDYAKELKCEKKPGLKECLAGKLPLSQAVHPTDVSGLFFCPAGLLSRDVSNLLAGKRIEEIIDEALKVFDRVVVDSAPIHAVSDCLVLAPYVEAVCLVIRARSTPVKAIQRALRTLAMANATPLGFVMNRMSPRFGYRSTYYYYGEEYHEAERALNAGNPAK